MVEIEELKRSVEAEILSAEKQNLVKDRLRFIQSQSKWIADLEHSDHIQKEIDELWEKLLKTV